MPGSREEDFFRNTSMHFFTPKLLPLGLGGHEITISCLLTLYRCYIQNLPNSSREDVNTWRTKDDDGRQPIAIGHKLK